MKTFDLLKIKITDCLHFSNINWSITESIVNYRSKLRDEAENRETFPLEQTSLKLGHRI